MNSKLLIVEDDPLLALDLQYEVEQLGWDVVGISESAEEALAVSEIYLPKLALMDVNISGAMDGIQTARLLQRVYAIPVIFLTSHTDEITIRRAAAEMPYGYLMKPLVRDDLKAALMLAEERYDGDAVRREEHQHMATAIGALSKGILTVSLDRTIQYMNAAAEELTGMLPVQVKGKNLSEVVKLREHLRMNTFELKFPANVPCLEEFGWTLSRSGLRLVSISFAPQLSSAGDLVGYVVILHSAADRLRTQTIALSPETLVDFEEASLGMVQLDEDGRVARVNHRLVLESEVDSWRLLGRSLTELSMDPDPRISDRLVSKLLGVKAATGLQLIDARPP